MRVKIYTLDFNYEIVFFRAIRINLMYKLCIVYIYYFSFGSIPAAIHFLSGSVSTLKNNNCCLENLLLSYRLKIILHVNPAVDILGLGLSIFFEV